VTDVVNLIVAGLVKDKINDSGGVFGSHLLPIKCPVFLTGIVEGSVSLRKSISSVVAHPNVIACSCEHKCWGNRFSIEYPLHHVALKAMLEQNWRLFGITEVLFGDLPWDSPNPKDVAVFSSDIVRLNGKSIFVSNLVHSLESVTVLKLSPISPFIQIFHLPGIIWNLVKHVHLHQVDQVVGKDIQI